MEIGRILTDVTGASNSPDCLSGVNPVCLCVCFYISSVADREEGYSSLLQKSERNAIQEQKQTLQYSFKIRKQLLVK